MRTRQVAPLFLMAAILLSIRAHAKVFQLESGPTDLQEISSTVEVYYRSMRFNGASNEWNFDLVLRNTAVAPLVGPIVVLVESFSNASGPMQPDGRDDQGKAFYEVTRLLPEGGLATGQFTQPRIVRLGAATGVPQVKMQVYGQVAAAGPALGFVQTLNEFGQPLPQVTVSQSGPAGQFTNRTDASFGVATIGMGAGTNAFRFTAPGFLGVWRTSKLIPATVIEVPSPRLTRRDSNLVAFTSAGGGLTNTSGHIEVIFPLGAFGGDGTATLTPLTGQTLPGLLPGGWSPLQAFWLELTSEPAVPLPTRFNLWGPVNRNEKAALVHWDETLARWEVASLVSGLGAAAASVQLAGSGAWALVVPDAGQTEPPAPLPGLALPAATPQVPDYTAFAISSTVSPGYSSPSKRPELVTATATLIVSNRNGALASGTLLRGTVRELYEMRTGPVRVSPFYEAWFVGYQRPGGASPATLGSQFPLRPVLLLGGDELLKGTVHVDIEPPTSFAGAVFTETGGNAASGRIQLSATTGSVAGPQAVHLSELDTNNFSGLVSPGMSLVSAFQLGVGELSSGLNLQLNNLPTNTLFILARVLSQSGAYGLEPLQRLSSDSNGTLHSIEPPGEPKLPGITGSGQYVVLGVSAPQSLITGVVQGRATNSVGGLIFRLGPWVTTPAPDGSYKLLTSSGDFELSVVDPVNGDSGTTPVSVGTNEPVVRADVSIAAIGPQVIDISPAQGTTKVPLVPTVTINFNKPVDPLTVTRTALQLMEGGTNVVAADFALNVRGDQITLLPSSPLSAQTTYVVVLSPNITDPGGVALTGQSRFTFTTAEMPFARSAGAELITYEPTNGVMRMSGTGGFAQPGKPVMLVNETSGRTATVLAGPDGSFAGTLAAAIDDAVSVSVVNDNGTRDTIVPSRQIFRDGSVGLFGRGGTIEVTGEKGPIQVTVEPGAIANKTKLHFEPVTIAEALTVVSNIPPIGGQILGAMRFRAIEGDELSKPLDVSFPASVADMSLPAGVSPSNCSFGLVIARNLEDGPAFELVDRLLFENGKLVTHSPPFFGLFGPFEDILVMPLLMAVSELQLVVNGHVYAAKVDMGTGRPIAGTEEYLGGAMVTARPALSAGGLPGRLRPGAVYTTTRADGAYTLLVTVWASDPSRAVAVRALHPRFAGLEASSDLPDLDPGMRFAIGNVLTPHDVAFALPNTPRNAPPELSVSHAPQYPQPGDDTVITLVATDNNTRPSIDGYVDTLSSLTPGVTVSRSDITFVRTNAEDVGAFGSRATFTLNSRKSAVVSLIFTATDGQGGRAETPYTLTVGGFPPVPSEDLPTPDANDVTGPRVITSFPAEGERSLGLGQPLVLLFDKPISRGSLNDPSAVRLRPDAGKPVLTPSSDQLSVSVLFSGLMADTDYALSLGSAVTDLRLNPLDQDPLDTGAQPYQLHFHTAPLVTGMLTGIQNGGGSLVRGIYAYVLERSGALGSLVVYDLSVPSNPAKVASYTLPGYPRDLTLVPNYSFKRRADAPVETKDLLAIVGGYLGMGNVPWLRVVDISNPLNLTRVVGGVVSTLPSSAVTRVLWSAPQLAYLENGDVNAISTVDLQTYILNEYLRPEEFSALPAYGLPGVDANGDGDYVDPGDTLPVPPRRTFDFSGKVFSYTLNDSDQYMIDFAFQGAGDYVGVLLDRGQAFEANGVPGTNDIAPCYRTLVSGGLNLERTVSSYTFTNLIPKRLFTLFGYPLQISHQVSLFNLALASLRSSDGSTNHLVVLNITDPTHPRLLTDILIPQKANNQGLFSLEQRGDGLLALASDNGAYLIDPRGFTAPPGASPHPALVGFLPGLGGGVRTFGLGGIGLSVTAAGGLNRVVQTAPTLQFIVFPGVAPFVASAIVNQSNTFLQQRLEQALPLGVLQPSRFRDATNAVDPKLDPPGSTNHYYVQVNAPGSAGPTIDLALEVLDWAGQPLKKRGFLFPPVQALGTDTLTSMGQLPGTNDAPVRVCKAWRLSSDKTSPFYNVYLSRPFALLAEEISRDELKTLDTQLERDILWSGYYVRASLEPGQAANPTLGAFASVLDVNTRTLQPVASVTVAAFPADYLQSPNPGPVAGVVLLPSFLNSITPHNGELVMNETDLSLPGRRLPLEFRRNYSGQSLYDGLFGRGWDFNFNQRVVELAERFFPAGAKMPVSGSQGPSADTARAADLVFYTGGGRAIVYRFGGTNAPPGVAEDPLLRAKGWVDSNPRYTMVARYYLPPSGLFDLFLKFKDGRYLRLEPNGTEYWYTSAGRLVKIYDRYESNSLELNYNSRGELVQLLDELRRPIKIGHWRLSSDALFDSAVDAVTTNPLIAGRIARLLDYSHRDVLFFYTADGLLDRREGVNVETTELPGSFTGRQIKRYQYSGTADSAKTGQSLIGVRDDTASGAGFLSVTEFSGNGRDNVSKLRMLSASGGPARELTLQQTHRNTGGALEAGGGTMAAGGPDGSLTQVRFDSFGRITNSVLAPPLGEPGVALTNRSEYYTNGFLKAVVTPEGSRTEYTYDFDNPVFRARGNLLQVRKDPGPRGGGVLVATTQFDPWYSLPAGDKTDFNTNHSTIVLFGDHRDTWYISKDGQRESFSVNQYGQVETHTRIDGITMRNLYTPYGFLWRRTVGTLTTTYNFVPGSGTSDPALRGLASSVTDAKGYQTFYSYDELNRLVLERRGDFITRRRYDAAGNQAEVQSLVEPGRWRVEHNDFNPYGVLLTNRISEVEVGGDKADLVTIYVPDEQNRIKTVIVPSGAEHSVEYDHLGRVKRYQFAGVHTETYAYDYDGNLTNRTIAGASETYLYDGHNRLRETISPLRTVTSLRLDGNGNVRERKVTNAEGRLLFWTEYEFDGLNRLRATHRHRDDGIATLRSDYDTLNRAVILTDALGNVGKAFYDENGQTVRREMPNFTLELASDPVNNLTNRVLIEPAGRFAESREYNELNQLTNKVDNLGHNSSILPGYDGRVLERADREGHITRTAYTLLSEAWTNWNPNAVPIVYTYSTNREVTTTADAAGNTLREVYDAYDRLTTSVLPNGATTTFSNFNAYQQPELLNMPRGLTALSSCDLEGKVTNRVIKAGASVLRQETWRYDGLQRPEYLTDSWSALSNRFDLAGYVREFHWQYFFRSNAPSPDALAFSLRQEPDMGGFRTNLAYPSGLDVYSIRDRSGRLQRLEPSVGAPILGGVGWNGELTFSNRLIGPNLIRQDQAYDGLQRLQQRRYKRVSDGALLAEVRYAYDKNGAQLARQWIHRGGRADFFAYDPGYRLRWACLAAHPAIPDADSTRVLAGFGVPAGLSGSWNAGPFARVMNYTNTDLFTGITSVNPDSFNLPPLASVYGPADSLLHIEVIDGFSRQRDEIGNVTRAQLAVRLPGNPTPVVVPATLIYNDLSQLVRVERDDGVVILNEYSLVGYRMRRQVSGPAARCVPSDRAFLYDGERLIEERDLAAGGALLARYYYSDDGDEVLAGDFFSGGNAQRYYFLTDSVKSIMAVADVSGQVVERVNYDFWGQPGIELADTAAPVLNLVEYSTNSLLFVFSEAVLPPLVDSDGNQVRETLRPLGQAVHVRRGGTELTGSWHYEENAAGAPFGASYRFVPASTLSGSVEVVVDAGAFRDEWGNANAAVDLVNLSIPAGAGNLFTRSIPAQTGPVGSGRSVIGSAFLFHGQYFDYETGLLYCRARFYDPLSALFLQRDPGSYTDGVNQYAAFANNPVNFRDPGGQWVTADSGNYLLDLGNQADLKQDGFTGYLFGQFLNKVGTVLTLGTRWAEGDLLIQESGRQGTYGLMDRLKGADLMVRDIHNAQSAYHSVGRVVRGASALGAGSASRVKGYVTALRQRRAMQLTNQKVRSFLRERGLSEMNTDGFESGMKDYLEWSGHETVEIGIRAFSPNKAAWRPFLEKLGFRNKPARQKGKTGLSGEGVSADGKTPIVTDTDAYYVKINGRLASDSEAKLALFFVKRSQARAQREAGFTGHPNLSIQHGAQLNLPEMVGDRDVLGHDIDHAYLQGVGHGGAGFAIRVGAKGQVAAFDVPMSHIAELTLEVNHRLVQRTGRGLPANWFQHPAQQSPLMSIGEELFNQP